MTLAQTMLSSPVPLHGTALFSVQVTANGRKVVQVLPEALT